MRDPPLVLIVDDNPDNREILTVRLASQGYATAQAADGEEALAAARSLLPDLILLDVMMPRLDGFEVCRRLKADASLPFMPIILVTAKTALADTVAGLDAGADEYLTKPVEHAALVARVRAILRTKALHDEVQRQKAELAEWNDMLERRVEEQVAEIERIGRLRRFLPPQVAELVLSAGSEAALSSRRTEVTVLFADLRGFTAFAEAAAPDRVMALLAAYHNLAGPLIERHEGTLERFLGDGLMVIFNAPLPCSDATERAMQLAFTLCEGFRPALADVEGAQTVGIGIGIARGPATVGPIGFAGRLDYSAVGRVTNRAARLCDQAEDGQILVDESVHAVARDTCPGALARHLDLKGIAQPVHAYAYGG